MNESDTVLEFSAGQRFGAGFFGIFMICFGMPFTLTPLLILPEVLGIGDVFMSIFMICFCIPFLLAGLAVQYFGFTSLRVALFPNSVKAQKALTNWGSDVADKPHSVNDAVSYFNSKSPAEQRLETKTINDEKS
ncbi:MAG: hypothetical protein QF699_03760, partial [Candidatus Poseidoniaceae archaeon]|nr:hypothetical protein [Candidatus Poseidoniaceae archaeon]